MATNNAVSSNVEESNLEAEIARGEQDDVLEDYPKSVESKKVQGKPRPNALPSRIVKRPISRSITAPKPTSTRMKELARPTKQRVLMTLRERASILSPALVDNLIRIIEEDSCLTPEEAAQVLRRKKARRLKKVTRSPVSVKKWERKIAKVDTPEAAVLDRDATMCQYLMAECFVKSILEYQCRSRRKDIREIAEVILKRLTSLMDGYTDARDDDRATQQLRLLADVVACWIADVLIEVAETRKEALEEYCAKRQMKMMDVDDDDDDRTDSRAEDWKQTEPTKVIDTTAQQEGKDEDDRENGRLSEKEITDEDTGNEIAEEKQENEIAIKEEREDEIDERKDKEREENEARMEE